MSIVVTFVLLEATGARYRGSTTDQVAVRIDALILDFRRAVKVACPLLLQNVEPTQLLIYKNFESFKLQETFLDPIDSVTLIQTGTCVVMVQLRSVWIKFLDEEPVPVLICNADASISHLKVVPL